MFIQLFNKYDNVPVNLHFINNSMYAISDIPNMIEIDKYNLNTIGILYIIYLLT